MNKIKFLLIAIFSFSLCTNALSMEEIQTEETYLNQSGTSACCNSKCFRSCECCTHWGFKRWVYGIKEYVIDRCLCCTMCGFDPIHTDRRYVEFTGDRITATTDCGWIGVTHALCTESSDKYFYNNPIGGILCLPIAAPFHILAAICGWHGCCGPEQESPDRLTLPSVLKGSKDRDIRNRAYLRRQGIVIPDDDPSDYTHLALNVGGTIIKGRS
jgi:hypothetical protein